MYIAFLRIAYIYTSIEIGCWPLKSHRPSYHSFSYVSVEQAALQQAAASSLANPALIPGLLHGMQSLAAAGVATSSSPSTSASDMPLPPQIMMQPLQQSVSD